MKRALVVAALASVVAVASYFHAAPGTAGCGSGGCAACACGAGEKTAQISWDANIETPAEKVADADKSARPTYSIPELKTAKPLLVYYFVEGLTDAKDDSYKLSQNFETGGLAEDKVLNGIKTNWRAKKVALDLKADRKDAKNQARLEFWSFTGTKLSVIAAKDEDQTNPKPLASKLTSLLTKNRDLCNAEIKRIEDAAKAAPKSTK